MIAISSHKPFSKSDQIARNQIRAKESWEKTFDGIIYFGEPEPELVSAKTQFIPCDNFPHIWLLVLAASQAIGYACLINADIVVIPSLRTVWPMPKMSACTSRRYEFDPNVCDYAGAKLVDYGVDFFLANPFVWRACCRVIPRNLRIGHCAWDSWMLSFLNAYCGKRFCDITNYRCVFHPKHEERERPYHIGPAAYSDLIGLPQGASNTRR